MSTSIPKLEAGCGRITSSMHGNSAVLSELSSTYPLKLISARVLSRPDISIVYVLSYGGGLVGGDKVHLTVKVNERSSLVLLSQGSTKVFTTRLQQKHMDSPSPPIDLDADAGATVQKMDFFVSSQGSLYLLPDPVTCFRSASYKQLQTFHLSKDSTLVLLDWITSGRKSRGEEWSFSRYYSLNEIFLDGVGSHPMRLAKDGLLLEEEGLKTNGTSPKRSLAQRLAPYSCYANVILCGPQVQGVIQELTAAYEKISVMKLTTPPDLLWSLSPIICQGSVRGTIVRVAGKETELVKDWLREALVGLAQVVGVDVYRRAFAQ
ncbi:UreD-domain-containing protein [Marasmius fiardii PR-910]|nr:UreD-domain-containing protein [Marasmius fiardii PR-910]